MLKYPILFLPSIFCVEQDLFAPVTSLPAWIWTFSISSFSYWKQLFYITSAYSNDGLIYEKYKVCNDFLSRWNLTKHKICICFHALEVISDIIMFMLCALLVLSKTTNFIKWHYSFCASVLIDIFWSIAFISYLYIVAHEFFLCSLQYFIGVWTREQLDILVGFTLKRHFWVYYLH
jgi:hypothetical protein